MSNPTRSPSVVRCPHCFTELQVAGQFQSNQARCGVCRQAFAVEGKAAGKRDVEHVARIESKPPTASRALEHPAAGLRVGGIKNTSAAVAPAIVVEAPNPSDRARNASRRHGQPVLTWVLAVIAGLIGLFTMTVCLRGSGADADQAEANTAPADSATANTAETFPAPPTSGQPPSNRAPLSASPALAATIERAASSITALSDDEKSDESPGQTPVGEKPAEATDDDKGKVRPDQKAVAQPNSASPEHKPLRPLKTYEVVELCDPSVALVRGKRGSGTGFLIRPNILATNHHVISGNDINDLKVHFPAAPAGKKGPYRTKLLWMDATRDVAFLEVRTQLSPLKLHKTYALRKGAEVTLIGSPGVGDDVLQNAVTRGVMSTETKIDNQPFHQVGASINPGNSGGPVLDSHGRVIGMITSKAAMQEGIAFSIPAATLSDCLVKMQNQTPGQIAVVQSVQQLEMVLLHYALAGDLCGAIANSKVFRLLTRESRSFIRQDLRLIHDELVARYEVTAAMVLKAERLPSEHRQSLKDLINNYRRLRVSMAAGTGRSAINSVRALNRRHAELVSRCCRSLNMKSRRTLTWEFNLKSMSGKCSTTLPR